MIEITESFTAPGNSQKPNEDFIYASDRCAAVLDGATNLNGSDYGANEFVRDFCARFDRFIKSLPLFEAINRSIKDLYEFKFKDAPAPDDIELYSSAAAAFVHEKDGKLFVLTLGDCTALVFTDNEMRKVYDPSLDKLDGEVVNALVKMRENSGGASDIRELVNTPEIGKMLIANRKKMNKPNGYASLSFDMKPLALSDATVFDVSEVNKIVMFSDGFKSVENEIADGKPIREIYEILRAQENADKALNKRPRFKMSDDVSFVECVIS